MQKQRELSSFPLPPLQRMKLQQLGFLKVEDVLDLKPTELAKGTGTLPGQVVLKSSSPQVKKSSGDLVLIEHSSSSSIPVDNFSQGDKRTL